MSSATMVRAKKTYCQNVFRIHFSHINNKYCCGIYEGTEFVQLHWHGAIDEWYRFFIQCDVWRIL